MLKRWNDINGWCFFSLSLVLFLCVTFLINRLKKRREQATVEQVDKEVFNREVGTLLAILIIFSSTYMLRGGQDFALTYNMDTFVSLLVPLLIA